MMLNSTSAPPSSPSGYDIGQNFSSALAIGLAAMLCTFALLAFYFCRYVSLGNRQHEMQQAELEAQRFARKKCLESLPVVSWKELSSEKNKKIKGGESCAVCLGDLCDEASTGVSGVLVDSSSIRLLPQCGHCFHCHCVDEWLKLHMVCPVCRTGLSKLSRPEENLHEQVVIHVHEEDTTTATSIHGLIPPQDGGDGGGESKE